MNNGNNTGAGKGQWIGWLNHTGSIAARIRMPTADTWNFDNLAGTHTAFSDGVTNFSFDIGIPNNNYVGILPTSNGNSPAIVALGITDPDINLDLSGKGAGAVRFLTQATAIGKLAATGGFLLTTTAAPLTAAGQVSFGNTTAAAANCNVAAPTPTACLVINVAGTVRYIPYY